MLTKSLYFCLKIPQCAWKKIRFPLKNSAKCGKKFNFCLKILRAAWKSQVFARKFCEVWGKFNFCLKILRSAWKNPIFAWKFCVLLEKVKFLLENSACCLKKSSFCSKILRVACQFCEVLEKIPIFAWKFCVLLEKVKFPLENSACCLSVPRTTWPQRKTICQRLWLGEVWEIGFQMFKPAQIYKRNPTVQKSTTAHIAPNQCWQMVLFF